MSDEDIADCYESLRNVLPNSEESTAETVSLYYLTKYDSFFLFLC